MNRAAIQIAMSGHKKTGDSSLPHGSMRGVAPGL